jgi:hypothetical protein
LEIGITGHKFRRGDNSTYTFTKRGVVYLVSSTPPTTIFLHAHLQVVYYNCVKFHKNPISCLGGVALTSPSLHTERISEYKLNYLPFKILDSNHIRPSMYLVSATPPKRLIGFL